MLDYLVIGGGPAGAAAAILLAEAGASVRLACRARSMGELFGESLSPGCAGLLQMLGLWDSFKEDGHLPCYAHRSAWGSSEIAFVDLIFDPRGHGWHIDRELFERRMLERAGALGVSITHEPVDGHWSFQDDHWQGTLRHEAGQVRARRIIDASGKASWFARRQGIERIIDDRQIALIAVMQTERSLEDTSSLVETVPEGWWYSAPIPQNRLVVSLFTDAGLIEPEAFDELLAQSRHTRERAAGARMLYKPRFVAAGGGRLGTVYGPGWLAVGDAAMNYEPLSAHGITLALRSAIDGARALMAGSGDACPAYERRLFRAYAMYHRECRQFYRAETRFPDAPFWARRRSAAPQATLSPAQGPEPP